jgi:hypothetical protein
MSGDRGYLAEITPHAARVAASIGLWDATAVYSFDDVVGTSLDDVEYFSFTKFTASFTTRTAFTASNNSGIALEVGMTLEGPYIPFGTRILSISSGVYTTTPCPLMPVGSVSVRAMKPWPTKIDGYINGTTLTTSSPVTLSQGQSLSGTGIQVGTAIATTATGTSFTVTVSNTAGTSSNPVRITVSTSDPLLKLPGMPNTRFGFVKGPFYRCIKTQTTAGVEPSRTTFSSTWIDPYVQDPSLAVSANLVWTTADIPTKLVWFNVRDVNPENGVWDSSSKINQSLLTQKIEVNGTTTSVFYAPLCATLCPGPTSTSDTGNEYDASYYYETDGPKRYDRTLDSSGNATSEAQVGLYEYVFDTKKQTTTPLPIIKAMCYPRCGSTQTYEGSSNFCVSKSSSTLKPTLSGFSWCPNTSGDSESSVANVAPTNQDGPLGLPLKNKCYKPCPAGMMTKNESPYTSCVTKCPADARFIESSAECIKVPYLRATKDATETSNTQAFATGEEGLSATASYVSKVGLSNGAQSITFVILTGVLISGFVVLVLMTLKYQGAKQVKYA